jgi:hypothetical protein
MAKGKKQDIGDIIRDVMGALTKPKRGGRAAKLQRKIPKPPSVRSLRPRKPSTGSGPQPMPRKAGDKPPSVRTMPRRAEFPEPMVEGQKRYPAYNVQPIRPRKGAKSDEGNQDLRDVPYNLRSMPSRKQKPKRNKPKASPKRGAKY